MSTATLNWTVSREERTLIEKIVSRARKECDLLHGMDGHMDLTAAHANGTPLRLAELLEAEPFDFAHDVGGIARHIDRATGELRDCFVPRFAA